MKNNAMKNIHNMNQRALNSYASHQLNSLKNQFGTGQGSANKKPYQTTINTNSGGNKKVSSLWEELNEGKSKQKSGNHESSNVIYIKNTNPPVIKQQSVQPQNLQLEQVLKQIQDLEQALAQARNEMIVKDNVINSLRNNLNVKDNKIMELQGKLLDKTEQINTEVNKYNSEHNKLVDTQHKLNTHKLKLTNFINTHQNIEDQDQLTEMLGDLQIINNQ